MDIHKRFEAKLSLFPDRNKIIEYISALAEWLDIKYNKPGKKEDLEEMLTKGLIVAKDVYVLKGFMDDISYKEVLVRASESQFIIVKRIIQIAQWYNYKNISIVNHNSSFGCTPLASREGFLDEYLFYMKGYHPAAYGLETKAWIGFCIKQKEEYGVHLLYTEEELEIARRQQATMGKTVMKYDNVAFTQDFEKNIIQEYNISDSLQSRMKRLDPELWNVYIQGDEEKTIAFMRSRT
jgi:hypothetical protein